MIIQVELESFAGTSHELSAFLTQDSTKLGPFVLTESPQGVFTGEVTSQLSGLYDVSVQLLGETIWNGSEPYGPPPDSSNVAYLYEYGESSVGLNLSLTAPSDPTISVYGQRMPALSAVAVGVVVPGVGVGTGTVTGEQEDSSIAGIRESIATLEGLIDSGATTVVQDGQTVSFSQDHARKRLRELKNKLASLTGQRKRRPLSFNVNLR